MNPEGAMDGPPNTPRSPPLKFGPALVRSIVELPPRLTAAELLEFTWMLLGGPPTMLTLPPLPCNRTAFVPLGFCGSSTTRGMGDPTELTPHTAKARTSDVVEPIIRPVSSTRTRSTTSTRMKGMGASEEGAGVTPGAGHPVPGQELPSGKLIDT